MKNLEIINGNEVTYDTEAFLNDKQKEQVIEHISCELLSYEEGIVTVDGINVTWTKVEDIALNNMREYLLKTHTVDEVSEIMQKGANVDFHHSHFYQILVEGKLFSFELQTGACDEAEQPWNGDVLIDNGEDQVEQWTGLGKDQYVKDITQDEWLEIYLNVEKAIKEQPSWIERGNEIIPKGYYITDCESLSGTVTGEDIVDYVTGETNGPLENYNSSTVINWLKENDISFQKVHLIWITAIDFDSGKTIRKTCAIGQYDQVSNDDDIYYWFDDFDKVIGKHDDFEVLSYETL